MDKQKKLMQDYTIELEMKIEVYEDILKKLETLLKDNEVSKASLIVEFNTLKNAIKKRLLAKLSEL